MTTETPWTPDRPEDATSAIFQALGAASMCWMDTPTGIFDSTRAKWVGDGLIAWLAANPDA